MHARGRPNVAERRQSAVDGNHRCANTLAAMELLKTDKTLLPIKKRSSTSSGTARDCAWWPFCTLPTDACGGWTCKRCVVFGNNGISPAPDLTTKFAVDLRRQRTANQKAESRALASANKRHKTDGGGGEVHNTGWRLSEPIRIPGPVDPQRGSVVVAPSDTRNDDRSGRTQTPPMPGRAASHTPTTISAMRFGRSLRLLVKNSKSASWSWTACVCLTRLLSLRRRAS